jgi:hypothetical protein
MNVNAIKIEKNAVRNKPSPWRAPIIMNLLNNEPTFRIRCEPGPSLFAAGTILPLCRCLVNTGAFRGIGLLRILRTVEAEIKMFSSASWFAIRIRPQLMFDFVISHGSKPF